MRPLSEIRIILHFMNAKCTNQPAFKLVHMAILLTSAELWAWLADSYLFHLRRMLLEHFDCLSDET